MTDRSRRRTIHARTIAPISTELAFLPMHEAAAMLRARTVSSVELTKACVSRIDQLDGELVAFISKTLDRALVDAARLDAELARGIDRGALHGIPVALKDLYDAKGEVTTAGSKIFGRNTASDDSAVTARLRSGGAVLLGKTNLHEWAFGVTNQNPHFGSAKNPWDTARIPGGSSGGSAIAVATGMCFMSPGSDTGGSIRIPAALCGIAGIKPTYGRVSLRGVVPLAWSLDHAGPLARSVRDLALTLQVIAGHDPLDPGSADVPAEDYSADLEKGARGLRIAVPTSHFFTDAETEVEAAVRDAAKLFASLGARVEERALPHTELLRETQRTIISSDAAAYHREHMKDPEAFGPYVLDRMKQAWTIGATELALARRTQAEIRAAWTAILREVDLILTPT